MRFLPVLISLIILSSLLLQGCGRPRPTATQPVEYEEGLTRQAWMMLDTGADFSEIFKVQEEAVRLLRQGKSKEDPVAVLEQMAFFLFSEGRLEEAFTYFNEAEDSLKSRPERPASESMIMLYGDLSQFYDRLGMSQKAIEYSDSAMAVSRRLGGKLMPDLWRFRTEIYANDSHTAEAFSCLDSACHAVVAYSAPEDTAYMLALMGGQRADLILSLNPSADSVALAVSILDHSRAVFGDQALIDYMGLLGYGLYLKGEKQEGIRMMEKTVDRLRDCGDLEMSFLEMRRLIEVYTAEKSFDKVSVLYKEYTVLSDSMSRARHNLDLVTAKVRSDVAAKEKENMTLQKKLQSQHRQKVAIAMAFILFALLALVILWAIRGRARKMERRRDAERARRISVEAGMSEALSERDSALERIETIKSEISGRVDADILHHPQFLDNNTGPFIRAFIAMYPRYVEELRRDYPLLTDTDMIFCMLIYLKHTTEEISVYLNISRASVNSARYRIRSKLRLAKEENLDKFLQRRDG